MVLRERNYRDHFLTTARTQKSTMRVIAIPVLVMLLFVFDNRAGAQSSQPLLLSDAINSGLKNYQSIKAKRNYLEASAAMVQNTRNEYLPNVIASVQHDYGTINGSYGPLAAVGIPGVASSGPTTGSQ